MRELPCGACGRELPFEAPPCGDGHGTDCPELACTGCGAAILLGSPLVLIGHRPRHDRRQRSARHHRPRPGHRLAA